MKARALSAALLCAVLFQQGGAAAAQADDEARVRGLLARIEQALRANDRSVYSALLASSTDQTRAENFAAVEFRPGVTRAVVIERDRQQLVGALPGLGHRLMVDAFIEYGDRSEERRVGKECRSWWSQY